ncbi:MAG TPA: hypothetical protein VMV93_04075 [Chloroflexota bacterium]|nr:hypothetical protein [Chloroflexota bacterium]
MAEAVVLAELPNAEGAAAAVQALQRAGFAHPKVQSPAYSRRVQRIMIRLHALIGAFAGTIMGSIVVLLVTLGAMTPIYHAAKLPFGIPGRLVVLAGELVGSGLVGMVVGGIVAYIFWPRDLPKPTEGGYVVRARALDEAGVLRARAILSEWGSGSVEVLSSVSGARKAPETPPEANG